MKRSHLFIPVCLMLLTGCGSDEVTGPASIIGQTFTLVSISGDELPALYYVEPGDFSATALSGSIVFQANGFVRAEATRRVDHVSPLIPDEEVTSVDSVPYQVAASVLLILRMHGWDTARVDAGLRVNWTTSTAGMGQWLYLRN